MSDDPEATAPSWRQRARPVGFEIAYRLEGDRLVVDSTRKVDTIRLASVERIRFTYAPSNLSSKGFRTKLSLSDGKTLTFGNLSWRSLTNVERDDAGYRAFVEALVAAIRRANPAVAVLGGKPRPLWLAIAAVGLASLAMLAALILRAAAKGETSVALLGLLLAAASFWQVWPMIALNRPRELPAGEIPDELVPGRR